jgi:hypothetical protein
MKPALTIAFAAAIALPLFAAEPQKTTGTGQTAAAKPADVSADTAPSPTDSPLVAAMKRSKRRGRKPANVITNETLKSAKGGHVSTSTVAAQHAVEIPVPELTPAEIEAQKAQAEKDLAEKKARQEATEARIKKDAEEKKLRAARATEAAEANGYEGSYDDAEDVAGPETDTPPPPQR